MGKQLKTIHAAYRQDPSDMALWHGKFTTPEFYNGYKGKTMQEVYNEIGAVAQSIGAAVAGGEMTLPESTPIKELKKHYKGQDVTFSEITFDTKTGEVNQILV